MIVLGLNSVPEHGIPRRPPSPGHPQGERCPHQVDAFLPHIDAILNACGMHSKATFAPPFQSRRDLCRVHTKYMMQYTPTTHDFYK
jgi:hypothetical protein